MTEKNQYRAIVYPVDDIDCIGTKDFGSYDSVDEARTDIRHRVTTHSDLHRELLRSMSKKWSEDFNLPEGCFASNLTYLVFSQHDKGSLIIEAMGYVIPTEEHEPGCYLREIPDLKGRKTKMKL